jgi:hypothetical protein
MAVRACWRWTSTTPARCERSTRDHPIEGGPRGLPGRAILALTTRRSVVTPTVVAGESPLAAMPSRRGNDASSPEPASEDIAASVRRNTRTWTLSPSPVWSHLESSLGVGMPPIAHRRTTNTVTARRHASILPRLSSPRLGVQPASVSAPRPPLRDPMHGLDHRSIRCINRATRVRAARRNNLDHRPSLDERAAITSRRGR